LDPAQPVQAYRAADYAAYYRMVLTSLREAVGRGHDALMDAHYPEPVDACAVCRWESRCAGRRRADDHLSFIANTSATHRAELAAQGHPTWPRSRR
jgi:predicted RecB family nuclease